jgi:hypothetical protein
MEFLGVILFCLKSPAETCEVLTSPYVYESHEECLADTTNMYSYLGMSFSPYVMVPMCVELKQQGEPT